MSQLRERLYPLVEAAQRAGVNLGQLNADIADGLVSPSFAVDGWGRQVAGRVGQAELQRYKSETVAARAQEAGAKIAAEASEKAEAERAHERGLLLERLSRARVGR